jgi:hypothetical protein
VETLTRKLGPLPVWMWGVLAVSAFILIKYWRSTQAGSTAGSSSTGGIGQLSPTAQEGLVSALGGAISGLSAAAANGGYVGAVPGNGYRQNPPDGTGGQLNPPGGTGGGPFTPFNVGNIGSWLSGLPSGRTPTPGELYGTGIFADPTAGTSFGNVERRAPWGSTIQLGTPIQSGGSWWSPVQGGGYFPVSAPVSPIAGTSGGYLTAQPKY